MSSDIAGSDFEFQQTEFILELSEAQIAIPFTIIEDTNPERTESFSLTLLSMPGYGIGPHGRVTIIIEDNERKLVYYY